MYEVKENLITLEDGTSLQTFSRDVVSANIIEVEAGTTGYKGGDTGHGWRTYIRINDASSTDITVKPIEDYGDYKGAEIILGGDAELRTIIMALKFVVKVLEDQANEVYD